VDNASFKSKSSRPVFNLDYFICYYEEYRLLFLLYESDAQRADDKLQNADQTGIVTGRESFCKIVPPTRLQTASS
jgi:hypothetical protein